MANGVTVKDKGYDGVFKELKALGHDISVGVHVEEGAEGHDEAPGVTVVMLAQWHEFGVPEGAGPEDGTPPERSFVRSWFDEDHQDFLRAIRIQSQQIIKKKGRLTSAKAASQLAVVAEGRMKQRILQGKIEPALSDVTIDAKGSDFPLFDTGQLANSIKGRSVKR